MLRGLIGLDRLLLHQNRVTFVHRRAFHDLGKLTTFYLFNNNLTVLTGETMDYLVSLQYLRLNGNQWICDCRARSLWDWFKRFKGSSSELECHVPASLAGKDLKRLKASDLEGCLDNSHQIRTSIFSTKTRSGKLPSTETPLREGSPRCCLPESDKSSIISSKGLPDPSSYNSRQITNNPLKEKENISKPKFPDVDPTKNGTRNKQRLNDDPVGTFSNTQDDPLGKLKPDYTDNLEPSTAPSRKKKKCSKKPKPDAQCLKSEGSTSRALNLLFLPIIWFSLTIC
ncbi:RTN4R protein, partial [Atractosteus spatula]|nr:RTN4R protein [Atractosteus spatula]